MKSTDKSKTAKAKKTTVKKKNSAGSVSTKKSSVVKKNTAKKSVVASKSYEGKTLVIVESPAKAKTIERILGSKYAVLASVGHVRDLPKGRMAIDVEHNFEPEYIQVRGKADLIKNLKAASASSSCTLLASDPDREGEAIAWHLATLLDIDPNSKCRIRMHEITENGAKSAVSFPDAIRLDLVNAQQARRVLDRLVGYELSPLLWNKIRRGLSAGRVQSVALRIVCEKEDEIDKFTAEEYWLIDVTATQGYKLRVVKYKGKDFTIPNEAEANRVEAELGAGKLIVEEFNVKETEKKPFPPYKTSTLQQDVSRRCGYAPRRTMRIAQNLYEGIELPGRGPTGLITYMRTDSLRLAPEALTMARNFIKETYGNEYLSTKVNIYSTDSRVQDAHEAIRATHAEITPDSIKEYLTQEQYNVYKMIWSRYIASQMKAARIAQAALICTDNGYQLKQTGSTVVFDGWGKLVPIGVKNANIKPARAGEKLNIDEIIKEKKFTLPPARYSEASLIKALEDEGIGRPSTYATIIDTLSVRSYVERNEDKRLVPTKLGRIVNSFLVRYFDKIVNVNFTANMESELDEVENGDLDWKKLVSEFWSDFKPTVEDIKKTAENMRPEPEFTGENCPECGKPLVIKSGRFGEFIACTGYPECKFTKNIVHTIGVKCPKCGRGELVRRRSQKGKTKGRFFYACTKYPDCDYISWKKPEELNKSKREDNDSVSDM